MGFSTTAERVAVIQPAHSILRRKQAEPTLDREQLIRDVKASQARFERGECRELDVWAHMEEVKAYVARRTKWNI